MRVGGLRDEAVEARQRRDDAHVRRRGLDDDGRDPRAVLGEDGGERLRVVVADHERLRSDRRGHACRAGQREGGDPGAGLGEQAVGVAVIMAGELHEQIAAGRAASEADGGHGGLGAGRDQPDTLDGTDLAEADAVCDERGELDLPLGGSAEREPAGGRFLHRGDDLGLCVAEQRGAPRRDEVDVLVARGIGHGRSPRRGEEPRRPADRPVGAHRRVHPAGDHRTGGREKVVIAVGHRGSSVMHGALPASLPG